MPANQEPLEAQADVPTGVTADAPAKAAGKPAPKPRAIPKPRPTPPPSAVTPGAPGAKAVGAKGARAPKRPVAVPVVVEISAEQVAAAEPHGNVRDGKVFVTTATGEREVGDAIGDAPLASYINAYYEAAASVERFHARLIGAELSVQDISAGAKPLRTLVETAPVVGDLATLAARIDHVLAEAETVRTALQAERDAAREVAVADRERIVAAAEALAAKPVGNVHWKDDTEALRLLLDEWKAAQKDGARLSKDVEKALWKRFTTARSAFDKARKAHFATLDKDNSDVAARKEALVKRAEALQSSTDWDSGARGFKDLMGEWKAAGRGRRAVDDALWKRFQGAQEAFFEAKRHANDAHDAALEGNVAGKEALVVEAEALLPITDLAIAKTTLRSIQDRYEAAGQVPRAEMAKLNARIGAVEKALRDADERAWTTRNPELEARASGALAQLTTALADLDAQIAAATAAGDKAKVAKLGEARAAKASWLEQIQGVVS